MIEKKRVREEWEKRDDARTLARAEEIKADKERLADAQKAARDIASEEIERVKGIIKVAGKQVPKKPKTETTETVQKVEDNYPVNDATPYFNKRGYRNPACIGRL